MPSTSSVLQLLDKYSSFTKNAHLATDQRTNSVFKGVKFLIQKNFSIAASGSLYILIDYTTYLGDGKQIVIEPATFSSSYGPVIVNIYRGTDYTGGTPIPAYNVNTLIGTKSQTTFTQGATGTAKGTVTQEFLVGSGSTNQSSGGGAATSAGLIVRGNDGKTLIEILNESGETATVNFLQEFYEI